MEYENINERFEEYKDTWQQSVYMQRLEEKQRERDFLEGYVRGYEEAKKLEKDV